MFWIPAFAGMTIIELFTRSAHLTNAAGINRRLVNIYFQALQEKLAYILNFNFIIGIECSNAVFKHGNAVRTGSCQYRCPRLQCLFYTQIAEALTFEFFHP